MSYKYIHEDLNNMIKKYSDNINHPAIETENYKRCQAIDPSKTGWIYGDYIYVYCNSVEIAKLMIKKGDIDIKGRFYNACQNGYIDIVKLLINEPKVYHRFCLESAIENGYLEIVKLLIKRGFKHKKFIECYVNFEVIRQYIDKKNINKEIKQYLDSIIKHES